jgi:hypothetical protein
MERRLTGVKFISPSSLFVIFAFGRARIRGEQPVPKAVGLTAEREQELLRIRKANKQKNPFTNL